MAMSGVPCAVWRLVMLSAVWTNAVSGRFVDDLSAEEQGLDIHTRTKRYLCRYRQFQCMSGQCVDFYAQCNGVADCADMSDETAELCSFVECPPNTFRCAYGACVNGSLRCDGKWDCVGGSDENSFLCGAGEKTTTPATQPQNTSVEPVRLENQCSLPEKPKYGFVTARDCELGDPSSLCRGVKGTPVQPETVLNYTCDAGFTLAGSPEPECKQGSFTTEPPTCEPVCGIKSPYARQFLTFGDPAFIDDYPWTVAIYRNSTRTYNMTQICAGSLVSDRLVVSAAHCFWDQTRHAQQPKELFKFAVGKYYRDWGANEEFQFRDAKEIAVHERYQGRRLNHANDIAVIVLDTPVEYNTLVRPICIDWQNKYENIHLEPRFTGTVVGWGYTEKGEPSDILMKARIPFVDFRKCWDTIAEKLRSYLTNDKFCAGYTNGTGARSGDSGGGFIFLGDRQWYLRGIVSVGESDITNANVYTAFTTVTDFLNFIRKFFP